MPLSFLLILVFQQINSQTNNTNLSNGIAFDGEPYLTINPVNNQNLVVAWMGLKLTNGLLRIAIKTRSSFDGGKSWSTTNSLPHLGNGYGSADVSMAYNKNGLLYLCYIDWKEAPDSGGIYVVRSTDGGLTWDTPSKAFDMYDVANKRPIDRPWLVVDKSNTSNTGNVYITSKPAPWIAAPNRNYFKFSTDQGHSWSAIANVDGGTHLVGDFIAQPMATPATTRNGIFCAVYPSYVISQNVLPAYYLATSKNNGQTFNYTTVIASMPAVLDTNCKNGYLLLTSPIDSNKMIFFLPNAASGDEDILAIHSNDGGLSWSSSIRVNDDAIANGKLQDMVWASYNENGKLAVTWRDRRNAAGVGFWHEGYDFYYSTSSDNGQTFTTNKKLSNQTIAFDSILTANGNDFMSCVYSGDTLNTVWGDSRSGKMNIYYAKTIAGSNTNIGLTLLEEMDSKIKIFPNPSQGNITVEIAPTMIGNEIYLFDANGNKVRSFRASQKLNQLDIALLSPGVWYLSIKDNMQDNSLKFIKE